MKFKGFIEACIHYCSVCVTWNEVFENYWSSYIIIIAVYVHCSASKETYQYETGCVKKQQCGLVSIFHRLRSHISGTAAMCRCTKPCVLLYRATCCYLYDLQSWKRAWTLQILEENFRLFCLNLEHYFKQFPTTLSTNVQNQPLSFG